MPKDIKEERLRWIKPIEEGEVKLKDAVKLCPHSPRSLCRWLKAYREGGEEALTSKSTRPKTQPNETPIRVKEEVIALRKETKLCAQKLHWKLKKRGLVVPVRTIGKILKDEGLVKKYKTRKLKWKYVRLPLQAGELVEIDVKYVPYRLHERKYYQYTAIDKATRWRYVRVFDEMSSYHSCVFLKDVMNRFPNRIRAIKTDNHSTLTNRYTSYPKSSDPVPKLHMLDKLCEKYGIIHYLIDKGKPAQNGTVERSHRSDQESFYDEKACSSIDELNLSIRLWNMYYNDLEHCGLNGKTPNEMLYSEVPNVLA